MDLYTAIKVLHVLGAAILFGTGIGIAFFMVMAHRTGIPAIVAHTSRVVVIADFLFTATAVVLQPITGAAMILLAGYDWRATWILAAIGLYVVAGTFWLPVVFMQRRMRTLATEAAAAGAPLSADYRRLYAIWFILGFPAFSAVLMIFWLMVAKPA